MNPVANPHHQGREGTRRKLLKPKILRGPSFPWWWMILFVLLRRSNYFDFIT